MEKRKLSIQSLLYSTESATVFVSGRDPKAGREVGKLYSGKKGRLQICPDWRLVAGRSRAGGPVSGLAGWPEEAKMTII